ncbi:uncharacterized protein LOC131613516 [Vicia villosa]|uniref:uncharacterized protein LOC131613516 n=1 Tax=Vicia villosa TaxID=3911 RepID=UPI00273C1845|nr:uncharacterized protein LOC131613516 [Vicia villosa]
MDPIKYLFEKPALTGRIVCWQMLLSEYDIQYRAQKAIKGSVLADHLASQPIDDDQSLQDDFPDEEIMYLKSKDYEEPLHGEGPDPESRWGLIFDGAVNAYGRGIGAVIVMPQVINQIKGERETRHPGLIPFRDYAQRLLTFFNKVEFHHIPREENQMADALATLASMYQVKFPNEAPQITIMRLDRPAHVVTVEAVTNDKPWFYDIKIFLQKQEYQPGASSKDRRTLRRLYACVFPISFLKEDDSLYGASKMFPAKKFGNDRSFTIYGWPSQNDEDSLLKNLILQVISLLV